MFQIGVNDFCFQLTSHASLAFIHFRFYDVTNLTGTAHDGVFGGLLGQVQVSMQKHKGAHVNKEEMMRVVVLFVAPICE